MAELAELAAFSARLGRDPGVIQGAGGNTSVKLGDGAGRRLYVKASGLWLSGADTRPSFVGLALAGLLDRLAGAEAEPDLSDLVVDAPGGMRPSIETSLHAVLPHRVVVHTHSVNALAHLVQPALEAGLGGKLAGLNWVHVPYARPGLPLLRAVQAAGGQGADVLLLANHGLVFGAADVAGAARLQAELETRLALPARVAAPGEVERLRVMGAGLGWRPAGFAEAHGLGMDPASFALAQLGAPCPDHVVFLGPGRIRPWDGDGQTAASDGVKLALVAGSGVLVPDGLDAGGEEMVRCLAAVLSRVTPDAGLRVLDAAAVHALVHWDAEAFRRGLNKNKDVACRS